MAAHDEPAALEPVAVPRASSTMAWLRAGWRAARGRAVHWDDLHASPRLIAGLLLAAVLLGIALQRLMIAGNADFWWPALVQGWWSTVAMVWACWVISRPAALPGTARLFALVQAQSLVIAAIWGLATIAATKAAPSIGEHAAWSAWALWWTGWLWSIAAVAQLLWRAGDRRPALRALVIGVVACSAVVELYAPPARFWYAADDRGESEARVGDRPLLTQQIVEAQPGLLEAQLQALAPQRPGVIDLYAITFAPYAGEDVFRRESEMVASVVAERFDAAGRTLQLVNSEQTMQRLPWATPLNLERAIEAVAARMDREEDVLLIHLTSHGAHDGRLAIGGWPPIALDPVTPAQLRSWLDTAAIRWRALSISACYSGSWIAPLAGTDSLVMTASDAEHTSYGCGRRSELTFFGRAMFDEQLRTNTRSFEKALAAARPLIEQRERDAGKSDGYSNPQIAAGTAIREQLRRLETRLDAAASR